MINLEEIYKKLLTGKIDCREIADIIKEPEMKKTINSYINKEQINKLVPYTEEDLQNIYMIINITQFVYNNSGWDTGLSDNDYDILYSIMLANGGADVISVPITPSQENVVFHKYPALRGTLTKTFYLTNDEDRTNPSRKYLDEWKKSMENKIFNKTGRNVDLDNYEVFVFPKFDGVSGIFEMNEKGEIDRVLTRGYTETNEAKNITHVFKDYPKRKHNEFPNQSYGLKTEIMMQEDDLEYFNEKYGTNYKNSRSIVSAIINSDEYDEEKSSLLHIVPLRVGTEDGKQELADEVFEYPYLRCLLKDRERIRKFSLENKYVFGGLRCDGAVIHIIDKDIQKILGRENHKNNYEVAYKFTEEVEFSTLVDVTYNVGLFGRIAPVAKVKPVKLKGNTIENISLGSIARLKSLHLRKGDTIKVLYDIIPYLSFDDECKHNDGDEIEIPENCPDCGEPLEFTENYGIASCTNKKCPCRQKGKILNYLNKMNIDGISYGIINKLYEYEIVKSIKDLYSLHDKIGDIISIDGFGEKSIASWIEEIEKHMDVDDYLVFGSIGVEGVSRKTFEKILQLFNSEELLEISIDNKFSKLIGIPGIKEKTAMKIVEGIKENKKLIKFLLKTLTVNETKGNINSSKFSVCFTKVRDKELEKYIKECGGTIDDGLKKTTTYLVVPDKSISSSKVTKAEKYNIPVVTVDELRNNINKYSTK